SHASQGRLHDSNVTRASFADDGSSVWTTVGLVGRNREQRVFPRIDDLALLSGRNRNGGRAGNRRRLPDLEDTRWVAVQACTAQFQLRAVRDPARGIHCEIAVFLADNIV